MTFFVLFCFVFQKQQNAREHLTQTEGIFFCLIATSQTLFSTRLKRGRLASRCSNYTSDSKRFRQLFNTVRKRNAEAESAASAGGEEAAALQAPTVTPFQVEETRQLSLQSSEKSGGESQTFLCKDSFWKQHVPHRQGRTNSLKKTPPDKNPAFRDRRGEGTAEQWGRDTVPC